MSTKNKYDVQAESFLKKHGVDFKATLAVPQQTPKWAKNKNHGMCWNIELIPQDKNKNKIQFLFWDSIKQREDDENKRWHVSEAKKYTPPQAYSVLASIYTNDAEGTYKEFCYSFGFDEDSRKAEATFKECQKLNAKLKSIFTPKAIEELNEIR